MKLRLTCREAFRLILAGEDRHLRPLERWVLRAHVWACRRCPGAEAQVKLLRQAMPAWRRYREEPAPPASDAGKGSPSM